jgi:hypothetical protein
MNDFLEHLYYVTGFCAAVLLDQFEVGSILPVLTARWNLDKLQLITSRYILPNYDKLALE